MKRWVLVAAALAACGGSSKRAQTPADPERARIEAMRPPSPYETRSVRGFTAATTCGQGPYRIEATSLGARFGEEVEVSICAPRSLEGDYQFTKGTDRSEPRHFGSSNNSEHCMPTAAELARTGTSSTTSTAPSGKGPRSSTAKATSTTAPAARAPLALAEVSGSVGERCPTGTFSTGILDYSIVSSTDDAPWKPGMRLFIDVWSTEPLDLSGAVFVVIQRGVRGDMTADGWLRHREASKQWYELWSAYLAGEVTAGRASYLDMTARSTDAPPPPRAEKTPPRPSVNAQWIPGFWQRQREWIWSAGFWRVPESDIIAERTVEAPVAPPPVKTEPPPPPPTVTVSVTTAPSPPPSNLVWTPGYWAWNGSAYLWIEGAWRLPPQTGARWIAPTWTPRRGRVTLVPGGWSVRIGR